MLPRSSYRILNAYHILIDGLFDSVPILLAFMVIAFGAGEKAAGFIVSAGAALSTLAGLGTPAVSRSFGCMRATALITALYGAGFFLAAFTENIVTAGVCFILAVAGQAAFHNISFAYIAQRTERSRIGRIISDFTAIGDIGRIPLVSLAAFAAAYAFPVFPGWKIVCFGYGAVALCAGFWLFVSSRGEEPEGRDKASGVRFLPSFALAKDRNVALALLGSALNACSNDRIFTFLPLLLMSKGIDPASIGGFALGFTAGSFLGKMACGRCVDIFGPRTVFITAEAVLALLLGVLLVSANIAVIVVVALLLGIVTKGTVPVVQAIITEPVRDSSVYNDVFSINSFVRGVTNMATPLFFGLVAAAWGMNSIYAIMAVAALIAIIPVWLMKPSA